MSVEIELYEKVIRGSATRISAEIKDFPPGSALINPDSHSITIYDANGTLQGSPVTNPTPDGLGEFHYDYTVPATGVLGLWLVKWQVVKSTVPSIGSGQFNVADK